MWADTGLWKERGILLFLCVKHGYIQTVHTLIDIVTVALKVYLGDTLENKMSEKTPWGGSNEN